MPECPSLIPLLISSEIVLILDKVLFTSSDISAELVCFDLNAVCRTDLFSVSFMVDPLKYLSIFSLRSVSLQSSINKSKAFLLILFLEKSIYKSLKKKYFSDIVLIKSQLDSIVIRNKTSI